MKVVISMKRRFTFKRLLWTVLTIIICAIMGVTFIRSSAVYQSVDRNFFSVFSMIKYGLIDHPVQTFRDIAYDIGTLWNVRYENDLLRQELDKAYELSQIVKNQQEEIDRLKGLNELDSTYSDYSLIKGRVLNRSLGTWDQAVTINIGSDKGVSVGDGVLTEYGVIGKVIDVQPTTSTVTLLTGNNENTKVAVQFEVSKGNFVFGILDSYDIETNLFQVNLLEASNEIITGQTVTTSGMGGVYPLGIRVGTVKSIKNVSDGIGKVVMVESMVNFDNLKYVAVVKLP